MFTFLLWIILLLLCWPVAIMALILYPFIWLILLPFRLIGFTINLSFDIISAIFKLPFRLAGIK